MFNRDSGDLGFIETVAPNAFDNVDLSDILLLYNHELGNILARSSADSLEIEIDDSGVHFTAEIPDTQLGRDVLTNVANRNIQGMSFGFTVADDTWTEGVDGNYRRVINQIGELIEFSLTPMPAYKDTDVSVAQRSLNKLKNNDDKERQLQLIKLELLNLDL